MAGDTAVYHPTGPERFRLGQLVCLMFFTISGGPFGIEPLIGQLGPVAAVGLILLTPVLWAVPIALMTAELASAIPEEGGYYRWVSRGLGGFAGSQVAWIQTAAACIDAALYPSLFAGYLIPILMGTPKSEVQPTWPLLALRWMMAAGFIGLATTIHLRSVKSAGRNAIYITSSIVACFALFAAWCFGRANSASSLTDALTQTGHADGSIALGFAILMWNYYGWEDNATLIGEVESPRKNYPKALLISLPIITAIYLVPVLAGLSVTTEPELWSEEQGWPAIAARAGGPWLLGIVTVAAILSTWASFNGQVLFVSRLPYVLARDGWLPAAFAEVSPRTGVPTNSVLGVALVALILATLSFEDLVVLGLLLYSCVLVIEMATLIMLRLREPELTRPFRVPGGALGLAYATLTPLAFAGIAWTDVAKNIVERGFGDAKMRQELVLFVSILGSGILNYHLRKAGVATRRRSSVA